MTYHLLLQPHRSFCGLCRTKADQRRPLGTRCLAVSFLHSTPGRSRPLRGHLGGISDVNHTREPVMVQADQVDALGGPATWTRTTPPQPNLDLLLLVKLQNIPHNRHLWGDLDPSDRRLLDPER